MYYLKNFNNKLYVFVFLSIISLILPARVSANTIENFKEFCKTTKMTYIPLNCAIALENETFKILSKKTRGSLDIEGMEDYYCHKNIAKHLIKHPDTNIALMNLITDIPPEYQFLFMISAMIYCKGNTIPFQKLINLDSKNTSEIAWHFCRHGSLIDKHISLLNFLGLGIPKRQITLVSSCYFDFLLGASLISYDDANFDHHYCFDGIETHDFIEPDSFTLIDISAFFCIGIFTNRKYIYIYDPSGGLARCEFQDKRNAYHMLTCLLKKPCPVTVIITQFHFPGFQFTGDTYTKGQPEDESQKKETYKN